MVGKARAPVKPERDERNGQRARRRHANFLGNTTHTETGARRL